MTITKSLRLPDELREQLARPIGNLIAGNEEDLSLAVKVVADAIDKQKPTLLVTVGDIVAKSFNEEGIAIDLAIVDFVVKREEKFTSVNDLGFIKDLPDIVVTNPKGMLTDELINVVKDFFNNSTIQQFNNKPYIIRVIGEEDLATLSVILAAPINTHVFYGQPTEGVVEVVVTEEKKLEVEKIVSQFETV